MTHYRIRARQRDIVARTIREGWDRLDLPPQFLPSEADLPAAWREEKVVFLEFPVTDGNNFAVVTRTTP